MGDAKFRPIIVALLLAGLFAAAIINAGLLVAINNGSSQSIGDDPAIASYKQALESSLMNASRDANTSETNLGTSPVSLTIGGSVFDALGGMWKTMKEVPVTVYNLTFGLLATKLFGDPSYGIVLGVIAAIITITIIIGVVRLVASGDGG